MRSTAVVCSALVFAAGCAAVAGIEDTTTIPEGADVRIYDVALTEAELAILATR